MNPVNGPRLLQSLSARVAIALLLAGCGAHPTAVSLRLPATEQLAPSAPAVASPLPGSDVPAALVALRQQFASCQGVKTEVHAYSEGHFRAGQQVDALRKANYLTRLTWVKQNKIRADVLSTDNFLVGGATMVTTDGLSVRLHGAGLLGLLPITLDAKNDMLANNRNHRFASLLPAMLIGRLIGPTVVWRATATPGRFDLENIQHLDAEINHESVTVSQNGLREITMYVGTHTVVDYTFRTFEWNPHTDASTFEL